jgi:myo-inositol-1(or 4)-monophosphatase
MNPYSRFIKDAIDASLMIQKTLRQNSPNLYIQHFIGAGGDLSYGVDIMAESIYIEYLGKYAKIDSEESGVIGEGELTLYLDPLDGSDNFKSNLPYYGASLALCKDNDTVVALVVNFISSEIFVKTKFDSYKTYLDRPTYKESFLISHSLQSVGIVEKAYDNPDKVAVLKSNGLKFRSPGAIALSLAYAHYVKYVLFFGTMRAYDMKAGLFLCDDLHIYQDDGITIISKEIGLFEQLCKLFVKEPF